MTEPFDATVARGIQLEPEHLTDLGNAGRLVAAHGRDLRYCHAWGEWLAWDGIRWARDETGEVFRRAKETVRGIYVEAGYAEDEDSRLRLARHATRSESERALRAMIALAQSEPGIAITPDRFDVDGYLLNCLNGTLDLRTAELGPHDRQHLMTKLVPVAYDPAAECPTWEAFLARVMGGRDHLVRFLQRAIGYALTGDTREQVLVIFHGSGANGKTTLLVTVGDTLGDYARQTPVETLLLKRAESIPNDIARLQGARFVAAVEADGSRQLAESLIKQLTGGDRVAARFLHHEFFEFIPTFKIFLSTNHRPIIKGGDHAIWRRIRLLPFTVTIPPEEQDRALPEKLRAEQPGILRWAVEGCLAWQREGLGVPDEVREATERYRAELDALGDFLAERCVLEAGAEIVSKDLYDAYLSWAHENSEKPMTRRTFGVLLGDRGVASRRTARVRFWHGLRLRTTQEATHDASEASHPPISGLIPMFPSREEKPGNQRHLASCVTEPEWIRGEA